MNMKNIELCVRNKEGKIVAYAVGYSDEELTRLIKRHNTEGYHMSYAENTEEGYK